MRLLEPSVVMEEPEQNADSDDSDDWQDELDDEEQVYNRIRTVEGEGSSGAVGVEGLAVPLAWCAVKHLLVALLVLAL